MKDPHIKCMFYMRRFYFGLVYIACQDRRAVMQTDSIIIEPRHELSNNVLCATSKASDQPAHAHSLIRAFARALNIL